MILRYKTIPLNWGEHILELKRNYMAKYKLQEMPDVHNKGEKRVYPKLIVNRALNTKEFIEKMHSYNHALSESVVGAVIEDVSDALMHMLSMGYTVKLDGIGTFSLSLDFDDEKPVAMQSDNDKMLYRKVTVKDVNYKASPDLVKQLKDETDLERDMGGVSRLYKKIYTQEERIQRALKIIEQNGYICLTDYASINNLSRTVASKDLKEITNNPSSPIKSSGNGTHKVWVRRNNK